MWSRILKNTFWLTAGEVTGRALRIILVLYAARVLGAAEWGIFSYALSLAAMFTVLADIGLGAILTREIIKDPENQGRYLASSLFIKVVLLTIISAVIVFLVPLFTKLSLSLTLLIFIALLVASDNTRILSASINRAIEKMHLEAVTNVVVQSAIVLLGVWVLRNMPSPENLAISYLIGSLIGTIFGIWTVRSYLKKFFTKLDRNLIKKLLTNAWPFALIGLLGSIMLNTDIIMLGWLRSPEEIGYYSAAQKIIFTLYVLPSLIAAAAFPSWTRLANKDKKEFARLFEESLKLVFAIALPIAIGGLITGSEIINLFYGNEYQPATLTFKILLISLLINFPSTIMGNALFAYEQQKFFIKYGSVGALGNVLFNFLFIPQWGIAGAAIATVLTQIISNVFVWHKMKQINDFSIFGKMKKIFLANVLLGGFILLLYYWQIHVLIIIGLALVAYFVILYLFKEPAIYGLKNFIRAGTSH